MTGLAIYHLVAGAGLTALGLHTLLNHLTLPPLERMRAPGTPPRISVLIPARNEAERIGVCVDGWAAQDYPLYEVVVYDDESTDDTAARALAGRAPELGRAGLRALLAAGGAALPVAGGDDGTVHRHPRRCLRRLRRVRGRAAVTGRGRGAGAPVGRGRLPRAPGGRRPRAPMPAVCDGGPAVARHGTQSVACLLRLSGAVAAGAGRARCTLPGPTRPSGARRPTEARRLALDLAAAGRGRARHHAARGLRPAGGGRPPGGAASPPFPPRAGGG